MPRNTFEDWEEDEPMLEVEVEAEVLPEGEVRQRARRDLLRDLKEKQVKHFSYTREALIANIEQAISESEG